MQDFLNHLKLRNENNTDPFNYNCAGYALRTYSWYMPCWDFDELIEELAGKYFSKKYIEQLLLKCFTKKMLRDFPQKLRVIHNLNDLYNNEEPIIFRLGINYDYDDTFDCFYTNLSDYHYRVLRDGAWREKCGHCDPRECGDPFVSEWCNGDFIYNSDFVILASKI